MWLTIVMWLFPAMQDTLPIPQPAHDLSPITIRGRSPMGIRKGDTVLFTVDRFRSLSTPRVGDLIRNMPGFQMDHQGKITFGGKAVSRVFIDGEDLSGEQYPMVLRLLSSSSIDSIQVINQYHPNRMLRSIDSEQGVAINLITSPRYRTAMHPSIDVRIRSTAQWSTEARAIQLRVKQKTILLAGRDGETTALTDPDHIKHPFIVQYQTDAMGIGDVYGRDRSSKKIYLVKSFSLNRAIRSRILFSHGGSRVLQSNKEIYRFLDGSILINDWLWGDHRTLSRFQWQIERDAGRTHTGEYRIHYDAVQQQVFNQQPQNGGSGMNTKFLLFALTREFEAAQQDTWRLKKGAIIQWSNSIKANRYADDRTFLHRKMDTYHLFTYWIQQKRSTYSLGLFRSFSHLHSTTLDDSLYLHLSKSGVQFQSRHSFSQHWQANAAGMIGWAIDTKRRSALLLYHSEVGTIIALSRMQHLTLSFQVLRNAGDLNLLHAGIIQRSLVERNLPLTRLNYPEMRNGMLTYTRMDLSRSLMMGMQLYYIETRGGWMSSLVIHPTMIDIGYSLASLSIDRRGIGFMEYVIFPIRIRYRMQVVFSRIDQPQNINGREERIAFQHYQIIHEWRTQWKRRWSFEAAHRLHWNRQFRSTVASSTVRYAAENKFQVQIEYQRMSGRGQLPVQLMHLGCIWAVRKKIRITTHVMNALNQRQVSWQTLSPQSIHLQQMPIIGRSLSVRLSVDF
ncbi:MAG: hypothetical protein RIQ50_115 [Bacteroidota bacterium]